MRVDRDLDGEEWACLMCSHRMPVVKETRRMEPNDFYEQAKRATDDALRQARHDLAEAEAGLSGLREQVRKLEKAAQAFGAPKVKRASTHQWSPEARERQADRMRQRNLERQAATA